VALDFPKIPDFDLENFDGVVLDSAGAITLEPNNRIPSQYLRELSQDGSPEGWETVAGPQADGYHAYLFRMDAAVRQGGRQSTTPDTNEQAHHLFDTPLVSGGLAPTPSTPGVALPTSSLEAPVVTLAAGSVVGFPQGEYLAAISFVSKSGAHTLLSDTVQVTVNTNGKLLEFRLLLDADKTMVAGQGLWLSERVNLGGTPDPSTMRLQDVAPNTGRVYVVKGPYNHSGRTAPTVNETAIGTPPALVRGRDFDIVTSTAKWMAPGKYVFYQVQVNKLGESLPSAGSEILEFKTWTQQGIVFHPQLHPDAIGFRIYWRDYYESALPPMYQLVSTQTANASRYFLPGEQPVFYGAVDTGEIAERDPGPYNGVARNYTVSTITDTFVLTTGNFPNGQEVRVGGALPAPLQLNRSYWVRNASGASFKLAGTKGGGAINITTAPGGTKTIRTYEYVKPPESYQEIGVQGEPGSEDASGIGDPTGQIDPPVPVQMGIPAPGNYLVGYTRVLGGRETPVSEMAAITLSEGDVTAGKVIRMTYPPRVNKIPNSLYSQVGQTGLPISWQILNSSNAAVTAPDANHYYESAGVFHITTNGTIVADAKFPYAMTAADEWIDLDKERIETVAGWLEVPVRTGGTAYAEIVQYNAAGTEVGTPLDLATLTSAGAVFFEKTVAGVGAPETPDLTLHLDATKAKIRWGAKGASRNLQVEVHSLIWAPQKGVGRRYQVHNNPSDEWVGTTDPAAPYPNSHVLAIGQPPPTVASNAAPPPTVPGVAQINEVHNYDALSVGASPAGWTEVATGGATSPGAYASTVWGTTKTYRVASTDYSQQSTSYMHKNFSAEWPGGNDLFTVFRPYVEMQPDFWDHWISILAVKDTNGAEMAEIFIAAGPNQSSPFNIWGYVLDENTDYYLGQAYVGNLLEFEIRITGGGTSSGNIQFKMGVNGGARSQVLSQNRNLSGRNPRTVLQGVQRETAYYTGWAVQYGPLEVSTTPIQVEVPNIAPALTPLVQPDWPWKPGTILYGPVTSPVDQTITTSPRTNLGIAATFVHTGDITTERTILQLRNSAGTQLVGMFHKTDDSIELRHGATAFPVTAALPVAATTYRFDLVVTGANTTMGQALVFRTIGTGDRELIVYATGLDFTGLYAQRATIAFHPENTESDVVVTELGEYEWDAFGDDGLPINQGYVAILPADVTADTTNVGFEVDEFFVQPAVERTFAVFMRAEDLPDEAAPWTIVAYDAVGRSVDLGSVYADGTAVTNASPGWAEYWMTYTPPDGYSRIRIEHRGMTSGRYVWQKPLDAPGNISTATARNALRNSGRALTGTYFTLLNARIPSQSTTMMNGAYRETRTSLSADATAFTTEDTALTVTANATTDVLTVTAGHTWVTDATVEFGSTDTLPAPLAVDTLYYVRDATSTTFKVAATRGGAAINLTDTGTGTHTVFGSTGVSVRWRASDDPNAMPATWQTDQTLVPDLEWVEAEVTLEGDGTLTPVVNPGDPQVAYTTFMPMLLKSDRTPIPGGVYIGGGGYQNNLFRPYRRSLYDTETIGDRAAPRSITNAVGRLHSFTLVINHASGLDYVFSDAFLDDDHVIESPYHDLIMRVRFYEPPDEPEASIEYEGFDEGSPLALATMPQMVVTVERAEVIETAPLSGEAPGE
jgi:hypothetical protein